MLGIRRTAATSLAVFVLATLAGAPAARAERTDLFRARDITVRLARHATRHLPFAATNVALYWRGHPHARVTAAFSRDGARFSRPISAGRDELGEARGDGVTYGAILPANGATFLRITSDRAIAGLNVLVLADRIASAVAPYVPSRVAGAKRPPIVARADWAADESLRFSATGGEVWPPAFAPLQKLIVHHTATVNDDPNPAATVRAIYRYHAVTQGWGDIGYNFLIDASGTVYKGRNSHPPNSTADTLAGEDTAGNGVIGAHAAGFNTGSVGIALLGTFTAVAPTPQAERALEDLLAWKAAKHGIDPQGNGRGFPNIAGHRDVNSATECPGGVLYRDLPRVRQHVAARV